MNRRSYLLLLILITGLFVRVYRLGEVPVGFFADEASRGVEAYSLLTTGRDSYGESWPLFFGAIGAPIPPLQFYSVMPFVAVLGLNEVAVRMASVMWGMVGIVAVYFLGNEIDKILKIKNQISNIALWGALVMAVEPWAIHYSRYGAEIEVYMVMYILGWWSWLKVRRDPRWWIVFGLIWGLALYSYTGAYIAVPVTVGVLVLVSLKATPPLVRGGLRWWLVGMMIFAIMAVPVGRHLLYGDGAERWNNLELAVDKSQAGASLFLKYYVHQLKPDYFWGNGEETIVTRHFTKGLKPLLWIQAPLLLAGLFWVWWRVKVFWWILIWLLVYPVVGAAARVDPFSSRSVIGAPLAAILTGLGCAGLVGYMGKSGKWGRWGMSGLVLFGLIWSFAGWWRFYMNEYPLRSADFWGWQYGPREMMSYFLEQKDNYDELIMSHEFNAPQIFLQFYDPKRVCGGCRVGGVREYNFRKRQLFALSGKQLQEARDMGLVMVVKKQIYYPNGEVTFIIGELVSSEGRVNVDGV